MGIENLPELIRNKYQIQEWRHASAILEKRSASKENVTLG